MRQARTFLSRQQAWSSTLRCTRSATRREWYRASTRARRQAKFDWTKDAPISDRQVLEKYQEDRGTRPSAKPRGAPHAEQKSCCVGQYGATVAILENNLRWPKLQGSVGRACKCFCGVNHRTLRRVHKACSTSEGDRRTRNLLALQGQVKMIALWWRSTSRETG